MAHIRITRNDAGNCINFVGTSNPAYWNACLSARINPEDDQRIDIINDIRTDANDAEPVYEFYAVPYDQFSTAEGVDFENPQAAVDYINEKANVSQTQGTFNLTSSDVMSFSLDATQTSVVLSNGDSFGVNTIKALNTGDGLITIKRMGDEGRVLFTGLDHANAQIDGAALSGGLNDVINALNELFTVGPFTSVVIADPYSTLIADVDGVATTGAPVGSAINPASSDIAQGTVTGYNHGGWLSTDTISQAGEYFSFDIRTEGIIGMGLVHADAANVNGNATYGDPAGFCTGSPNSGHYGYQFSHWFHPTPNGPWTNYGANTSYSMRAGWSGTSRFATSPEGADWLADNPVKMRVGLDTDSFISIDYYDVSEATWIPCVRTTYPSAAGTEYKLGIKFGDTSVKLFSLPKVHLLDPVAPTLYYRYIESPDGNFYYPLFATEEEANYVSPDGLSHTHVFPDDPTQTTWYMPTGGTHNGTAAPTDQAYTEITSYTNADLAPSTFSGNDFTYEEGTVVNLQLYPQGATWSQSVEVTPTGSGLVYNTSTGYLQGTLADVAADTTYTVTVTRANAYGSSVGTFDITATDVAPVNTHTTPWTKAVDFSGNAERAQQVSSSYYRNALKMAGTNNQVAAPSAGQTVASGHPWATAIVFNADLYNSNQHIWNLGEGSGSTDDNIYLRRSSDRYLYFGWGRSGDQAECQVAYIGANMSGWHAVYIAHNGRRLGSGETSAEMAACFDIRYTRSGLSWAIGSNVSTSTNWDGACRMNRTFDGDMTIGGRGANRNFHGQVASMVVTSLRCGVAMPTDAEIAEMVTDPLDWLQNYKVGQDFRLPWQSADAGFNFAMNDGSSAYGTQVWLMGDGTSDSYTNMIRNQVNPSDQNYTKMNLISMVSNDIQNVTISGLS